MPEVTGYICIARATESVTILCIISRYVRVLLLDPLVGNIVE